MQLRKASRYFAWAYRLEEDDLLQEAFCRSLAGSRKCPNHVDIVKFLVETMRSIAGGEIEKAEFSVDTVPIEGAKTLVALQDSQPLQDERVIVGVSRISASTALANEIHSLRSGWSAICVLLVEN